jgi:hypothetical protein
MTDPGAEGFGDGHGGIGGARIYYYYLINQGAHRIQAVAQGGRFVLGDHGERKGGHGE